jgi:hypothetical protein
MVAKSPNTAFEGSLADLSVVDLLQALRISQKTGLLVLRGTGAEAALSFEQGRVVSCRHPRPGVHIGHLLIERGAARAEDVEQALRQQETAGKARKPLVSTLVDMGVLDQEAGWRALEQLVDMTVSEVQAWPAGTFSFDRQEHASLDGFRHSPAAAGPELAEDTQGMLTEALHILDQRSADEATSEKPGEELRAPAAAPGKVLVFCQEADWQTGLRAGGERFDLFVSDNPGELTARLTEWRTQGVLPALVVDLGGSDDPRWQLASHTLLHSALNRCPEMSVIALCAPAQQACSEAFLLGASATVQRPARDRTDQADAIRSTCQLVHDALAALLKRDAALAENMRRVAGEMTALRDCVHEIRFPHGPSDVSVILIRHLATLVDRCVLFLVREHDLLALGAFGLDEEPEPSPAKLTRLKLRLDRGSLLDAVAGTGTIHFGPSADVLFPARLHEVIGRPASPDIILLPLRTRERTAALIYGDFGHQESRMLDTVALQIAAEFAGMAFDLALRERTSPLLTGAPAEEPEPSRAPDEDRRPHYDDADLPVPVGRKKRGSSSRRAR